MRRAAACVLVAIAACAMLLGGAPARAFGSQEHIDIGNDALAMALAYIESRDEYWCAEGERERCLDEADLDRLRRLLPAADRTTYGHMVAAVDNVVNPIKFVEREGIVACYPSDVDDLYMRHVRGYSQLVAWRASHVNEMHFQGEGMASFWVWHYSAVKAGTAGECLPRPGMALDDVPDAEQRADTLVGSLVLNAIGDHFLQDHFAPGHIFTFRDTLGDYSALATHDRYNVLGAVYLLDRERWLNELKPLLTPEGIAAQGHLDAASVERAVASIEERYLLELWGDRHLWRNDAQRLFMVLLGARSILDVVDGYVTGVWNNHFGEYSWQQMRIVDGKLELPRAGMPYGEYAHQRRKKTYLPRGAVAHIGISGQGYAETSGESAFTGLLDLEFSTGFMAPGRKRRGGGTLEPRIYQWDLAFGYSFLEGADFDARGPTARVIFNIPVIDMRFSADGAYRTLEGNGTKERRGALGLRWELGFALATMHLAAGADHFIDSTGRVQQSPVVRYGITLSLPTTRIAGVSKLATRRLLKKRPKFLSRFEIPDDHPASAAIDARPVGVEGLEKKRKR